MFGLMVRCLDRGPVSGFDYFTFAVTPFNF